MIELHHGDCLEVMREIPDATVDCVITDPPYGTTGMKWDAVVSMRAMWWEINRVIKSRSAIVLFASQPFTTMLIASNMEQFKYCWVWEKSKGAGFLNAKNAPIKIHEDIAVFSRGTTANASPSRMDYYPQGLRPSVRGVRKNYNTGTIGTRPSRIADYTQEFEGYPTSVLKYPNDGSAFHPTQKPVDLLRYLVRTYTLEGETVLDFTMGSGSTGVACQLENRNFIGIEKDADYFKIAERRINEAQQTEPLFAVA